MNKNETIADIYSEINEQNDRLGKYISKITEEKIPKLVADIIQDKLQDMYWKSYESLKDYFSNMLATYYENTNQLKNRIEYLEGKNKDLERQFINCQSVLPDRIKGELDNLYERIELLENYIRLQQGLKERE